jgi:endonuclease YncB( thermonuclease family)
MRKSRQAFRIIRRLPPSLRLLVILIILIVTGIGGIWGSREEPSKPHIQTQDARSTKVFVGTVSVIDGDTLDLHGQRIRLHGIDAPESRQNCTRGGEKWRCGQQASLLLADHIGHQSVRCEQRDIDRYKRVVAVCYIGNVDINAWLVAEGWAMAYRQYSKDYVGVETAARQAHLGIWGGEVQPPWEWRRKSRNTG